jgi:hypothetical protein
VIRKLEKSEVPEGPFLLARNWDRFGGRASEIISTFYLAKRFNLPFRFIWPSDPRFPEMPELLSSFSKSFISNHLVSEDDVQRIPKVALNLIGTMPENNFLEIFDSANGTFAASLDNFFKLPLIKGDTIPKVLRDFEATSQEVWSTEILEIQSLLAPRYEDIQILHARYGDLVDGNWNNFVDPKKYVTGLQISSMVSDLKTREQHLEIISDTPEISKVFPFPAPQNLESDIRISTFSQNGLQVLIDLMKMKASLAVLAPEASAFSTLGAHLGAKEILPIPRTRRSNKKHLIEIFATKEIWKNMDPSLRHKFVSRDIDQEVNSLTGIFSLRSFVSLTELACLEDQLNPTSASHLAIGQKFKAGSKESIELLSEARRIGEKARAVHDDPLYLSITAEFCCTLIGIIQNSQIPCLRTNTFVLEVAKLDKLLEELGDVHPYQINKLQVEQEAKEAIDMLKHLTRRKFPRLQLLTLRTINRKMTKKSFSRNSNNLFVINVLCSLVQEIRHYGRFGG